MSAAIGAAFFDRPQPQSDGVVTDLRREILLTRVAIAITLLASAGVVAVTLRPTLELSSLGVGAAVRRVLFLVIVLFLLYGGAIYQFARLGYLRRLLIHRRVSTEELQGIYRTDAAATVAILVPAYKEEPEVVAKTLLSACLQEYPSRRVVLLIDDPPEPTAREDIERLTAVRELPGTIRTLLREPRDRCERAFAAFRTRLDRGGLDSRHEFRELSALYREVGRWFERQARRHALVDHVDELFVELTFDRPSRRCFEEAERLAACAVGPLPPADDITIAYRRLATRFRTDIAAFERKRYINLSHEPNKAMNLNSYLGLMGRRVREIMAADGRRFLVDTERVEQASDVPDADYVMMVDADSVLDPEYALRLIHVMGEPGNERLAVIQTPYSAFPGAPGLLERVAGATTDVQYIIHQGFTHYGATYWVGANAIVRKRALDDIATQAIERGFRVRKFIQDRTLIEDTESTIELVARGWGLYNYPARLAFSATPPDFGALLIQRRRWANGGLLILPRLLHHLAHRFAGGPTIREGLVRCHYLVSPATINVGLFCLLALPIAEGMETLWLPLTAFPYYALYTRDLQRIGYRPSDVVRVYALNLMLIPVNLAGVFTSLYQAWTGRKGTFGRTPKIKGRTEAPRWYLLTEYGLLAQWLLGAVMELLDHHRLHAAFALGNALLLSYAIVVFIRFSRVDRGKFNPQSQRTTRGSGRDERMPIGA